MDIQDFINDIERLTARVQTNATNSPWQYGAERLIEQLRTEIGPSSLATTLQYQLEGNLFTILAENYLLYQNYGVAGSISNSKGARADEFSGNHLHKYGNLMPKPSIFERYSNDKNEQFAIAKSIYKYGIRPKAWFTKDTITSDYTNYVQQFINDTLI